MFYICRIYLFIDIHSYDMMWYAHAHCGSATSATRVVEQHSRDKIDHLLYHIGWLRERGTITIVSIVLCRFQQWRPLLLRALNLRTTSMHMNNLWGPAFKQTPCVDRIKLLRLTVYDWVVRINMSINNKHVIEDSVKIYKCKMKSSDRLTLNVWPPKTILICSFHFNALFTCLLRYPNCAWHEV